LRIPQLEAVAIEFPGYIRNPDRAIAALGGSDEVSAALGTQSTELKLWLRPHDPLCHPIFAERHGTRALLLRVSRPRSSSLDGDAHGDVEVTVAAAVRWSYRFRGLADFQYLPVDPKAASRSFSSLPEKNRPESAEVYKTPQPLLLVPPLFSRADMPLDFAFGDGGAEGAFRRIRGRRRDFEA
jgi:general transcription factor 3C polypeptide 5 (transcription factor C subunit 1)